MSVEASHLHRASSPVSSGRSSPANPRIRSGADDGHNRKDKNYRRYASGVERALALFDTALQEWADYISFLGRLLKALQARPSNIVDIPHRTIVAKRLAQCLNPGLPSGVHQKALEVYGYVFSVLKKEGLRRDLSLYLPGLSPMLSFASLSVKPNLLSLFETFILALDPITLRPALKAIIQALLPGLDEETSEEFERTHNILNKFKETSGRALGQDYSIVDASRDQYFWQCLFLASITSSSRRQGALAYLIRNLPKLGSSWDPDSTSTKLNGNGNNSLGKRLLSPEAEAVASPEPGLLIRCFAAGLCDEQLLIQRGFLDLLVTHLPLHSAVLHVKVTSDDLQRLVAAAASVVARREMSLNRRLWTWFLGPEHLIKRRDSVSQPSDSDEETASERPHEHTRLEYFQHYGLAALVSSIQKMLAMDFATPAVKARPFRICLSLMDRWEIGSVVVPRIFLEALESVWRYRKLAPSKESFVEVLRSANVFFDGVESGLIWGEITNVLFHALQVEEANSQDAQNRLDLVLFIVTKFDIREEEMLLIHIPRAVLLILICIRNNSYQPSTQSNLAYTEILKTSLMICSHLVDITPQQALSARSPKTNISEPQDTKSQNQNILTTIREFYTQHQGNTKASALPIPTKDLGTFLLDIALQLITQDLASIEHAANLELELSILDKLTRKNINAESLDWELPLTILYGSSQTLAAYDKKPPRFQTILSIINVLETVHLAMPAAIWRLDHRIRQIIPNLVIGLWPHLSPSRPELNVEASRCILRIQKVSPESQLIESSITTLMAEVGTDNRLKEMDVEAGRRFITLWAHSASATNGLQSNNSNLLYPISKKARRGEESKNDTVMLARPLLLLLDSLFDSKTEIFIFTSSWIGSLPNLQIIINFVLYRLQELFLQQPTFATLATKDDESQDVSTATYDIDECLYYLRTLSNLVDYSKNNAWSALTTPFDVRDPGARDQVVSTIPLEKSENTSEKDDSNQNVQTCLTRLCLDILRRPTRGQVNARCQNSSLRLAASSLLQQMIVGLSLAFTWETDLDIQLIEILSWSVQHPDILLQKQLMDLVLITVRLRITNGELAMVPMHRRTASRDTVRSVSGQSLSIEKTEKAQSAGPIYLPPPALLDCLISGLSSITSHPVLEHWVHFLNDCLPFYAEYAFQNLLPLVNCFIKSLNLVFNDLQGQFGESPSKPLSNVEPTTTIITLLNGLEQVLARAHDQLIRSDVSMPTAKSPEQIQGFFGNMVSGVFTSETHRSKTTTANNRLTVLLCFKDTVRLGLKIWSWGAKNMENSTRNLSTSASFNHTSLRIKNRTRRILEHLFAAEALECLETLIELWYKPNIENGGLQSPTVFNLLQALDGSRPRNTIPAIFNAMYSRTNPNALDPVRKSSLTSDLSDINLAGFLVAYILSLEDDAMDEIWADCMTFLRDVLTNPLPHRQTLPKLLQFTAILGEKVDNTNFGEQRRMRRDLGDLFVRILAATFTTKPLGFANEYSPAITAEKTSSESLQSLDLRKTLISDDVVAILASILPNLSKILVDSDRITAATLTVSTQVLIPTFRWKSYPQNVTQSTLDILYSMSRIPEASKTWRKDVSEAFNDPKFFCSSSLNLAEKGWMPVLRQWALLDKDRMPDFLARLSSPTSAGIMFGVGASSARLEADRKTQLNLRRMAVLVLAADDDAFVVNLTTFQEKLVELMSATAASSPSSATRAEIFMLLRGLILKASPIHMTSFWPIITSELHDAISSLFSDEIHDTYNINCVVQACKLLETLLVIAPDEFQMGEWIFITDTVDAVYRPADWDPVALVDELAEDLDSKANLSHSAVTPLSSATQSGKRKPLLTSAIIKDVPKENLINRILRPFFHQLSINAFESTYSMEAPDRQACYNDLLIDIFDDSTVV